MCLAQEAGGGLTSEQVEILSYLSLVNLDDGHGKQLKTLRISGVNVQIANGENATGLSHGLGNLIVGYQELRGEGDERSGSHNIIVGQEHNYTSFGGLLAGHHNTTSSPWASVSGGGGNTASGLFASVSGGVANSATGQYSAVSGGIGNTATGTFSSVSGGNVNISSGEAASVSGG